MKTPELGDIVSLEVRWLRNKKTATEWIENAIFIKEENGRLWVICEGGWTRGFPSQNVEIWMKAED